MKKIFTIGKGFLIPDGTRVHSVIDPKLASETGLGWLDETSLALGHLPVGTTSKVHVHPLVTQLTWVVSGELTVKMRDPREAKPYMLDLKNDEAVVTQPGTFFQLINKYDEPCRALYIVSPAFLFECSEKGEVLYNDALVLDQSWDQLEKLNWSIPEMRELQALKEARKQSQSRLKAKLQTSRRAAP